MSPSAPGRGLRPAWVEIDRAALRRNTEALAARARPAALAAVVKADGYGHGAVTAARAALEGGAAWLAVALVEEGAELREAGIAAPVLLLSEPPAAAFDEVVAHGLRPAVYTREGVEAAECAARAAGDRLAVHLKVDTGMHRVGCHPDDAGGLAGAVARSPHLELEGVWTHCAVADEPDNPFTATQLDAFDTVLAELACGGLAPRLRHAANSAGVLAHPRSRYDLVRVGVAMYGLAPSAGMATAVADLEPALALKARVSLVKRVAAGEGLSYGLRYRCARDTTVATVPVGYADGVRRRLSAAGGEVLIRGRRHPIAGTVTMDQITVDCGDAPVARGDEVVLIGRQGDERISAGEWAHRLGTIDYEVVCGLSGRLPRVPPGTGGP